MLSHYYRDAAWRLVRILEQDDFSESELNMQIGRGREEWPIAILKELVDNALDASESAGVSPWCHMLTPLTSV